MNVAPAAILIAPGTVDLHRPIGRTIGQDLAGATPAIGDIGATGVFALSFKGTFSAEAARAAHAAAAVVTTVFAVALRDTAAFGGP